MLQAFYTGFQTLLHHHQHHVIVIIQLASVQTKSVAGIRKRKISDMDLTVGVEVPNSGIHTKWV